MLRQKVSDANSKHAADANRTYVIEPTPGWRLIDVGELWRYRDLFYFLVWRDIKGKYAQSVLGVGWAIIRPFMMMIVFTVIFGRLVKIDSDGVPYPLFSYAALVPWAFFSASLSEGTQSLSRNAAMLSKVYFPRMILPLVAVLGRLVDFGFAIIVLFAMMAWYGTPPTVWALAVPALVGLMAMTAAGIGLWLTAMSIQYRDVNHGVQFGVQLLMYAAPVVYPLSLIPERYQTIYALYPMVGVIEGFRSALLGTNPMPWDLIGIGFGVAFILTITGALYFRRMERIFADVA